MAQVVIREQKLGIAREQAQIEVLDEGMKGTLADYTIASVAETQLMDVFPFDANRIPEEKKSYEELLAEQRAQAEKRSEA